MTKVGDIVKVDLYGTVIDVDPDNKDKIVAKFDNRGDTYAIVESGQYRVVVVEPEKESTVVILKSTLVEGLLYAFQKSDNDWYLTGNEDPWTWDDVIENCEIVQVIEP